MIEKNIIINSNYRTDEWNIDLSPIWRPIYGYGYGDTFLEYPFSDLEYTYHPTDPAKNVQFQNDPDGGDHLEVVVDQTEIDSYNITTGMWLSLIDLDPALSDYEGGPWEITRIYNDVDLGEYVLTCDNTNLPAASTPPTLQNSTNGYILIQLPKTYDQLDYFDVIGVPGLKKGFGWSGTEGSSFGSYDYGWGYEYGYAVDADSSDAIDIKVTLTRDSHIRYKYHPTDSTKSLKFFVDSSGGVHLEVFTSLSDIDKYGFAVGQKMSLVGIDQSDYIGGPWEITNIYYDVSLSSYVLASYNAISLSVTASALESSEGYLLVEQEDVAEPNKRIVFKAHPNIILSYDSVLTDSNGQATIQAMVNKNLSFSGLTSGSQRNEISLQSVGELMIKALIDDRVIAGDGVENITVNSRSLTLSDSVSIYNVSGYAYQTRSS